MTTSFLDKQSNLDSYHVTLLNTHPHTEKDRERQREREEGEKENERKEQDRESSGIKNKQCINKDSSKIRSKCLFRIDKLHYSLITFICEGLRYL